VARAAAAAPAAAAAGAAGGPWLSILAIAVSIFAAVISFFRRSEPAAPTYYQPPRAIIEEPTTPTRRSSNAIDEIALSVKSDLASKKNVTPKQAILELQRGNARFWSGTPERPELNAMERRAIIIGQAPTVSILSCADSRVPVEIVFDQGLGSIFVVRVAGNILDATAMGSLEFSVKYLGAKVILVMGHEACGAVKGAMSMSPEDLEKQPAYLQTVLRSIKANLKVDKLTRIRDNRAQDREAVVQNVSIQVKKLQENALFAERVANGSLIIAGAFYEITSGIVDFFTLDKNGLVIDV
jgi:carbonic anhydrase